MVVQIKSANYDNTEFIVLVNGMDEIGETMSLPDAIDIAERNLVEQGYSQEDAEEAVNNMIQDYL